MDDRNGEVFDHAELLAQIGSVTDHDSFKELMMDGGLLDPGEGPKVDPTSASQDNVWGYGRMDLTDVDVENLVKGLPQAEMHRPALVGHPNVLMDSLHRISTDKVTQELLDNLSRFGSGDLESLAWNGTVGEPIGYRPGAQSSTDKTRSGFTTRPSPSASVESNVHTPTTSYESASPLSSNRTPIRSDESISPVGPSGHTPSTSPALPSPSHKPNGQSGEDTDPTIQSLEALIKRNTNKKVLIPIVTATRIDDPVLCKRAVKRTLPRNSESSSSPGQCGAQATHPTQVPDKSSDDAQTLPVTEAITSFTEDEFSKSKKRRKKTDNVCLPTAKRRCRKKVTIYQSSMSPEEGGIKIKIKLAPTVEKPKPVKKRRGKKQTGSDTEDADRPNKRAKKCVRFSSGTKQPSESEEQSPWGSEIPPMLLHRIFNFVVEDQGCVPSLVRFSSVCKLWNSVANRSDLWHNIDLSSPYIKQRCRIDRYFRWLLENRLENIRELNLNGWKFSNITMILSLIGTHCTDIESIGLAGWQGLHYEHLKSLLQDCPKLAKLDLSDVSPESKSANSAVSQKSVTFLTQTMGERLTQLILAHNTLTCLPQIISSLATHCPNLQVLDLSNIRRVSHTEFALNIEHLQEGCGKLRVLRITNSCVTLANVPLEKQVASPGFANLEELSIAGHQGTESLRITSVMDDNCLERILKSSHKLKLLDVRGCTRITDSSLVRVPAWDIQHLFLSGCYVTRQSGSGLELIAQKWSHSLLEIDLAWTTVTEDLNAAVMAFAEKGEESPLRILNLCGSSVTLDPVKAVLTKCRHLESLNLQSCRGLPRGVKRLYENEQLVELRNMLDKKDRDSVSESEDKKDECDEKQSPASSTNPKDDDFVT